MSSPPAHAVIDFATGVDILLEWICRLIARRGNQGRLIAPFVVVMLGRLRRTSWLLERLMARFRAGTLAAPRPPRPPGPAMYGPPAPRPPNLVPRRFGWLVDMMPELKPFGPEVRQLILNEPDMPALLAASPQAGRLLRSLCHMLGVDAVPLGIPPTPPRRNQPKVAAPPPATPAPDPISAAKLLPIRFARG